jgi:hypothetical protein
VVNKQLSTSKLLSITLSNGAKQFVVQLEFENISSLLYSSWFTPITNVFVLSSVGGVVIITLGNY